MTVVLVADLKTRKIGCVILQVVYGGNSSFVSANVPVELWETGITDDLALVSGSEDEWRQFISNWGTTHGRLSEGKEGVEEGWTQQDQVPALSDAEDSGEAQGHACLPVFRAHSGVGIRS